MSDKKDLLSNLFKEASAYTSIDAIEAMVEGGGSLAQIPVQPLYLAIKSLSTEKASTYLVKMSTEQRQACLDLDLWLKDDVDTEEFGFWVKTFSHCPDEEVRKEFYSSPEFFLYLKSRFNVWTFDVEEPEYPDHDNYFLTDDSLLLFEFDEDFPFMNEVRSFIRELYGEHGVEKAYAYLFKMVSGSFLEFQEEEYEDKKHRLNELGFVDYFDSLEVENTFLTIELLQNFLRKKRSTTASLDRNMANQNLHRSSIVAYKDKLDSLSKELSKIVDQKRSEYLQFSFIKLVNSTLAFNHTLKEGPIAMTRIGTKTRSLLELGFDYMLVEGKDYLQVSEETELFDLLDFRDLYKIGHSLVSIEQKKTKKILSQYLFEDKKEAFIGSTLFEIIEQAFSTPIASCSSFGGEFKELKTFAAYKDYCHFLNFFNQIAPFAHGFYSQIETLDKEGKIRDEFYLNYKIAEIDFECILLTTLANFKLGQLDSENKKLGLTINEYLKFAEMMTSKDSSVSDFIEKFGLKVVDDIENFLRALIEKHLAGYDFKKLNQEDYKHVGGPILLNLN